jgi:hypothetical protein
MQKVFIRKQKITPWLGKQLEGEEENQLKKIAFQIGLLDLSTRSSKLLAKEAMGVLQRQYINLLKKE